MSLSQWIMNGRSIVPDAELQRRKVRSWLLEHRGHVPVIQH